MSSGQGRGVTVTVIGAEDREDVPTPARDTSSVASEPAVVEVTDALPSTLVAVADSARTQLIIRNMSDADSVYLGYSSDIGSSQPPILLGAGKHWVESVWKGPIYGITDSGVTVDVAVQAVGEFTT